MSRAERWGWAILEGAVIILAVGSLRAEPVEPEPLRRVDLTLVGPAGEDAALDDRVRSLFDGEVLVVVHRVPRLKPGAVLEPESSDTLYLWITVATDRARVYVAILRARPEGPCYLLRDVELENGLDEVGSETLAQVAHSSATALWAGGPDTPKRELESALTQEVEPAEESQRAASHDPAPAPIPAPARPPRADGDRRPWELAAGIQQVEHLAGDEGRLDQPGMFAVLGWRDRVALRAHVTYLIPKRFTAGPAEVRLRGISTDLRMACYLGGVSGPRARVELGAGAWFVDWNPTVASGGVAYPAGRDERGYVVGAVAGELPLGPLRVGARLELRVPLMETAYDWEAPDGTTRVARSWISPGAALEVELPLTRF